MIVRRRTWHSGACALVQGVYGCFNPRAAGWRAVQPRVGVRPPRQALTGPQRSESCSTTRLTPGTTQLPT